MPAIVQVTLIAGGLAGLVALAVIAVTTIVDSLRRAVPLEDVTDWILAHAQGRSSRQFYQFMSERGPTRHEDAIRNRIIEIALRHRSAEFPFGVDNPKSFEELELLCSSLQRDGAILDLVPWRCWSCGTPITETDAGAVALTVSSLWLLDHPSPRTVFMHSGCAARWFAANDR